METMEIVNMYNNENLSLQDIADKVGGSRSSIQRKLAKDGWTYNKGLKKYVKVDTNETSEMGSNIAIKQDTNEIINNDSSVSINKDSNKTINTDSNEIVNIVNRTYGIPTHVDMALKLKATFEGKNVTEIVREILENGIEEKYFTMQKLK